MWFYNNMCLVAWQCWIQMLCFMSPIICKLNLAWIVWESGIWSQTLASSPWQCACIHNCLSEKLNRMLCEYSLIYFLRVACIADLYHATVHCCHYRKTCVCRVPQSLPWAKHRAHGKGSVCRVPGEKAHGKHLAHGKCTFCRVPRDTAHGK